MTCYCNKLPFAHEHVATKKDSEPVLPEVKQVENEPVEEGFHRIFGKFKRVEETTE